VGAGKTTDVVCITDFPPYIDASGSAVRVVAVGKEPTFTAKAEPALRLLLSGNPTNIRFLQRTSVCAVTHSSTVVSTPPLVHATAGDAQSEPMCCRR
jgi:hypothetical protein